MNKIQNNFKKVVFFITSSSLYCLIFNNFINFVYATDGGKNTTGNADVYKEMPYIAKYVIQWDFVVSSMGISLWFYVLGCVQILNIVYDGIAGMFFGIGDLFNNTAVGDFFKQFNGMIFPIMTVTLLLYALYTLLFGAKKMKTFGQGMTYVFATLLVGSSVIGLMASTTKNLSSSVSIDNQKCGKMSFGTCLVKDYIVDVPYYASQKKEDGAKNEIRTDQEFFGLRYNEGIGPDYERNGWKKDLNIPTSYNEDGTVREALGLKRGQWWKLDSDYVSYQRWNADFVALFLILTVVTFCLLGFGFRMGILVFDASLIGGLLPLISSTDIGSGQKIKRCFKIIFSSFAMIFLFIITLRYYGQYVSIIKSLKINWLSQFFLISGGVIGVFNLPNTIAKIFGLEEPRPGNVLQKMFYADRLASSLKNKVPKSKKKDNSSSTNKNRTSQSFEKQNKLNKGFNSFNRSGNSDLQDEQSKISNDFADKMNNVPDSLESQVNKQARVSDKTISKDVVRKTGVDLNVRDDVSVKTHPTSSNFKEKMNFKNNNDTLSLFSDKAVKNDYSNLFKKE